MKNLSEFYNAVSRKTDTKGTAISVADTKRVLSVAFEQLAIMSAAECNDVVAKGLAKAKKDLAKK